MNHRVTIAAGVAVILASISEFSMINGASWLVESIGAVVVVALAGTLTRQSQVPAAIGATALTALASVPMLLAQSPYLKVAGVALIAACGASVSGLRPLRALAGLATYLAALLLYLNLLHAAAQSFIGIVPTPASLHRLADLVRAGTSAAQYQPPVTARPGVLLVAAGSIGLAAVVVDFLAVRLHRPAIAGLPLLVVYLAPIATTAKVGGLGGGVAFLLAAAGYLTLLSSDGRYRLRGWGRVVTVWHNSGEDERLGGADVGALAATGRRIGLAAVCAALIVPLLLPGLTLHQLFGGSSTGGGHTVDVGLPDPVAQLRGLLSRSTPFRILTYRTTAANNENYLQVYVLNYNAAAGDWGLIQPAARSPAANSHLLPAPGLAQSTPRTTVQTTITIPAPRGYSSAIHFLPVPYWPVRIVPPGDWHEALGTLMIYSGNAIGTPLRYTVTSGELQPTTAELSAPQHVPAAIAHSYLGFMNPRARIERHLRKIAQRVTAGAQTAFGKAVALERWFLSSRFGYSTSSKLPDTPAGLLKFVTTSRRGFCQQFAFAMAVLARLVGIPSRIAVGFTAGTQSHGTWVVTSADAHAWPELYFTGLGWLRFEPTPSGAGGQDTAVEPSYVSAAASGGGTVKPHGGSNLFSSSPAPSVPIGLGGHVRHPGLGAGGAAPGASPGGSPAAPIGWSILAILVVGAAAPGTARVITRRRRWATVTDGEALASAAWQELCADLEDYGMRCRVSESPRAVAQRIRGIDGIGEPAGQAVARVTTVVEYARYAPAPVTAAAGTVRADVSLVRRALARSATRRDRWRARLLPASTLQPLLAGLRQAAGLLTGWTPAGSES